MSRMGKSEYQEKEEAVVEAAVLRARVAELERERDAAIERAHRSSLLFDDACKQTTEALAEVERLREDLHRSELAERSYARELYAQCEATSRLREVLTDLLKAQEAVSRLRTDDAERLGYDEAVESARAALAGNKP